MCTLPLSHMVFPANATRELKVLGHDGHALGVYGQQVRVLKERDEVRLCSLLERQEGCRLEAKVHAQLLRNFAHQTLERQLTNEKVRGLLVLTNLAQRNCPWPIAMRLFHPAANGRFARGLCRKLLSGRLTTCGLTCCLFRACHRSNFSEKRESQSRVFGTPLHNTPRKKLVF